MDIKKTNGQGRNERNEMKRMRGKNNNNKSKRERKMHRDIKTNSSNSNIPQPIPRMNVLFSLLTCLFFEWFSFFFSHFFFVFIFGVVSCKRCNLFFFFSLSRCLCFSRYRSLHCSLQLYSLGAFGVVCSVCTTLTHSFGCVLLC